MFNLIRFLDEVEFFDFSEIGPFWDWFFDFLHTFFSSGKTLFTEIQKDILSYRLMHRTLRSAKI